MFGLAQIHDLYGEICEHGVSLGSSLRSCSSFDTVSSPVLAMSSYIIKSSWEAATETDK